MQLEGLTLENYGVYRDKTDIDLSTDPKKPIVLVGGFNGDGKTTIFESIMVALYGKTYLGSRTPRSRYLAYISSRIHKHKGRIWAPRASVEVSFRFYHGGTDDTYAVRREWDVEGASVTETLRVFKNGEPMDDMDESLWQSYIESIIPIGIARLFFFDGEKIVRVARDGDRNVEIKDSMDVLMGTELVNRLDSDLDLYMVRKSGSSAQNKEIQNAYEGMLKEKDKMSSEIIALKDAREKIQIELDALLSDISAKELKIAGIGGGYADMRDSLFTQKAVLEEKIRHQGKAMHEILAGDTPLYMASDMLGNINKQIKADVEITRQRFAARLVQERVAGLQNEIDSEEIWSSMQADKGVCDAIRRKLDKLVAEPSGKEFFDMSPNEADWMGRKIEELSKAVDLQTALSEYGRTRTRLEKTESDLAKIPRDDEIGPKISEINRLHQEVGILRSEMARMGQDISSKESYLRIHQNKLRSRIDSLHKHRSFGAGVDLAARMKKALAAYRESMREHKMRDLEVHLLDTVRMLMHKDMASRIEIDRETFEIRVYGYGSDESIAGGLLSMGEGQMIGTALLWAIARTCGRPLPFVIDTPLSRLDGRHMSNLVNRFYPFASHQIVLLSTDREIGRKEYGQLAEYIARSYRIEYDEDEKYTTVREGYFMEEKIA